MKIRPGIIVMLAVGLVIPLGYMSVPSSSAGWQATKRGEIVITVSVPPGKTSKTEKKEKKAPEKVAMSPSGSPRPSPSATTKAPAKRTHSPKPTPTPSKQNESREKPSAKPTAEPSLTPGNNESEGAGK